jgi:hypothetical protein
MQPLSNATYPMELKFNLTTEPAIKATTAVVTLTSAAYVATCTQSLFGIASAIIIGVIAVVIRTYKTPPLCAVKIK